MKYTLEKRDTEICVKKEQVAKSEIHFRADATYLKKLFALLLPYQGLTREQIKNIEKDITLDTGNLFIIQTELKYIIIQITQNNYPSFMHEYTLEEIRGIWECLKENKQLIFEEEKENKKVSFDKTDKYILLTILQTAMPNVKENDIGNISLKILDCEDSIERRLIFCFNSKQELADIYLPKKY